MGNNSPPSFILMNISLNAHCDSHTRKENIPPSSKIDAVQVQRAKQRTALGVLSENELQGRSFSQGSHFSKHSSVSDSSLLACFGGASSSSYDVYIEEACEVVLAASGEEVFSDSYRQNTEASDLQNEDWRLLLQLSSCSSQDASMQSEPNECLLSVEVLCVSEYAEDIHRNLRECELKYRSRPDYLKQHPEITSDMRVVLVDWMVEVVREFMLRSETLHLAVNYLDRFLSCTTHVKRSKLQLVGTAALLIAAKYEEIVPPKMNEFVYITDSTFTEQQLIRMESFLLKLLAFEMAAPTSNQFLRLFTSIHPVCDNTENLALYLAELSLMEMEPFLHYTPSTVAAGAFCLACYTVNKSLWPDSFHTFTGYTMVEIKPCLTDLHNLYISAKDHPQQAIREKYKSSKYCRVSLIPPPAVLPFP
ncbi:cyclin-A1 [Aulostomus maculatus]